MPENEEKPKRVERFVYSEDDVAHILTRRKKREYFTKKIDSIEEKIE